MARKSAIQRWYEKAAAFEVMSLFQRKREPGPPRSIYVNQELPQQFYDKRGRVTKDHIYVTNQVVTSKYTIITFVPRNLLEQFRRVANCFFLAIAILQFFNIFSTISPGVVILPLLCIIAITAAKDGYEDIKRHQADREVNHNIVRVLAGGDWKNRNAMGGKSKTFVPGIPLPARRPKGTAAAPSTDIELLVRGTHPTALANEDTEGEPQEDDTSKASNKPYWKDTLWEDVRVGDFVMIMDNQPFPADILICSTSEEDNVAYIETKNLDGETNLKSRNATQAFPHLRTAADCVEQKIACRIDCDRPDVNMYKFTGAVESSEGKFPIDLQNVFLRGTVLRNTKWALGIVLFTGEDTKIVLNSGGTPSKRGRVERQMNPQVFINLFILAVMAVACGVADSVLESHQFPEGAPWLLDDDQSGNNPHINGLITFAFALITFQNIIPISLYLSIEFVRTCQAAFIYLDKEMRYAKTGKYVVARSWNLSDELGQIEYIFSDKTGTLTQNAMVFRHCSVGGRKYKGETQTDETLVENVVELPKKDRLSASSDEPSTSSSPPEKALPSSEDATGVKLADGVLEHFRDDALSADLADANSPTPSDSEFARNLNGFFTTLALCHTVLAAVDSETGAIQYKAQSPDEAALVQAAADVGYVFRGRERGEVLHLQTPHSEHLEQYELCTVLEFTSARKRMSVIVRRLDDDDDDRYFLLSKGADNVIFERLRPGNDGVRSTTEVHLDDFANDGLRTLTLAYKVLSPEEFHAWSDKYHEATVALEDREAKIEAVSDEIEHDLRLLGATAIEDRLQDGVPEAIADLKRAGIKVWVATGDKLETAIAIGYSTNLISRDSNLIVVRGVANREAMSVYEQLRRAADDFFPGANLVDETLEISTPVSPSGQPKLNRRTSIGGASSIVGGDNGNRPGGFVLVIDGSGLGQALQDEYSQELLLKLSMQCEGVICCRVSPLQKALVVKLVKDGTGATTLAIGDGANDVSMIQAADVGVGISGEEGLQAVNSSDYAIGQFRFLVRLLLVHGHWSYARNGTMIVNFFYKNFVIIGVLFWFQIYAAWSSQYVVDYTYMILWNAIFTLCPVIGIGVFDRIVDDDVLMALPELYRYGRERTWFGTKLFIIYMVDALYQSVIIFFLTTYTYSTTSARSDGYSIGIYEYSTVMAVAAVTLVNTYNGMNTYVWTGWVFFAVLVGTVIVWLFTALYTLIAPGLTVTMGYGQYFYLFPAPYFWFCIILTVLLSLLPRYLAKALKFMLRPSDLDIMRYVKKYEPNHDFQADRTHPRQVKPYAHLSRDTPAASDIRDISRVSLQSTRSARPTDTGHLGSRVDMSTGMVHAPHRGYGFDAEDNGVALKRLQSNLSERRQQSRELPETTPRRSRSRLFSLRRSLRKRKGDATEH